MNSKFQKYIDSNTIFNALISDKPQGNLKLIVTIPAYNEPDILETLISLKKCTPTKNKAEVFVLFNSSEKTLENILEANKQSYYSVKQWSLKNSTENLHFYVKNIESLPPKHSGVGLARKILMDEAVRRFLQINNEDGVIASLDADTVVSENYLADIESVFAKNKKVNVATFSFDHQETKSKEINSAIKEYELYLRYFKQALNYTGFPYAFHTIGSCFAVRASAYVKQGGMNRKQGGEDFYFLHKVFMLGNNIQFNNVKVYPSARLSDRVPFGTGPAISRIIQDNCFLTYRPKYFEHLKSFFSKSSVLFQANSRDLLDFYSKLDCSIRSFLSEQDFVNRITEINSNTSNLKSFNKRFFQWFDAFKIIKYLNHIHEKEGKIPTKEAAEIFLKTQLKLEYQGNKLDLLNIYKKLE